MTCLCPFRAQSTFRNTLLGASITRVHSVFSYSTSNVSSLAIQRLRTPCYNARTPRGLKSSSRPNPGLFLSTSSSLRITIHSYSTSTTNNPRRMAIASVPNTPADIIAQLQSSFDKAKESGDVLFFPSTVHKHSEFGVEWEITLCPALQNKPRMPSPHFDAEADARNSQVVNGGKKSDPFAPPYVPNLHVGELKDEQEGDEYVVLFNKFSVVPQHFLLVTKEFHSQTSPLLPPDLVQTYRLIAAAREAGKRFFAFYNCGDNSGASQPHKHLQLIPTGEDGPPIEKVARTTAIETAERPFSLQHLPYANHVRRLPTHLPTASPDEQEAVLSRAFLSLFDLALSTYRHDPASGDGNRSITLSYNVIITLEHIHVIPRKAETHTLSETGDDLSVNAMGFAGCLLVKSERELEAVVKESLGTILGNVGCKSIHDQQCEGACSM